MSKFTYLLIDLFVILPPFAMSFDRRVAFYKNWHALVPAILVTGTVFIVWDVFFTRIGVWSFNPAYLTGLYFFDLPIEEWLFFLVVPYSCVFILEVLRAYVKIHFSTNLVKACYVLLIVLLFFLVIPNSNRWYTSSSLSYCVLTLLMIHFRFAAQTKGWFLAAYCIGLLPFFIVNGILTALPVVQYNDSENLGLRIGSIPVEDAVYGMGLLLTNFSLYEFFKSRKTTS